MTVKQAIKDCAKAKWINLTHHANSVITVIPPNMAVMITRITLVIEKFFNTRIFLYCMSVKKHYFIMFT